MRILYIHSTLEPPSTDPRTNRFLLLSEKLEGDVLQPIWFETPQQVEEVFGPGSYPVYTLGKFRYHWCLVGARGFLKRLAMFRFYIQKGREIYKERRFDCIVAYSHMTSGVLAATLKLLTGARCVVEIVTVPELAYIRQSPRPALWERVMKLYSDLCLHYSTLIADRAHFLYPRQLDRFPLLRRVPGSVFHEFVPVSTVNKDNAGEDPEKYILLVGAPWYLKGADVLIKAFLRIAADFPNVRLRILGFYPDRAGMDVLTGGSPRIEIMKPRPNPEALALIRRAMVLVLPSRSEGLGRVLLEGMAAGIPLIGSDVGGIPTLVRDGENGFVVPVGDAEKLSERLRQLLQDPGLRRRMGEAGYRRAHADLDERAYVREFARMVEDAVGSRKARAAGAESVSAT
ncbi:MAG TPA: glycosyltransferase family 4 protein [Bryobacteraceae bacterium]|jgi:glycosyltransferase involved in cell wall biosynthesis|nr:glycosyltransferase family 4 protein [Bryobacteraceae bacterium]